MEEETPALAELLGMKMRALQRRAVEMGVGEDALEDAEDKSELIVLIMAHMQSSSGAAPSTMSEGAVEPAQSEQPAPDGPRGGSSPELIRLIYVSVMLPDVDLDDILTHSRDNNTVRACIIPKLYSHSCHKLSQPMCDVNQKTGAVRTATWHHGDASGHQRQRDPAAGGRARCCDGSVS